MTATASRRCLPNGFYWYEDDAGQRAAGLCELVGFSEELTRVYFISDDPLRPAPVFLLPELPGRFRPLPWIEPSAGQVSAAIVELRPSDMVRR
jgi:hypothetical protein